MWYNVNELVGIGNTYFNYVFPYRWLCQITKEGLYVFNVGDKIVYPMYGAGVIEGMEEKIIDGENKTYYVLKIPVGNLKITISTKKADTMGLREVSSSSEVLGIIKDVEPIEMSENWNQRYKDNVERIKTGNLEKVVQVFKTLIFRERKKSLSSIEKKLLGTAKQIILSEIILSQNIEKEQAEAILEQAVV